MTSDERVTHTAEGAAPTGEVREREVADIGREPFCRAEGEDDDGYDPYSDRPASPEPLFERDPWV